MTGHPMTTDLLRSHLQDARDMIAADQQDLLTIHPLPAGFSREAYGFAYIRAERDGMRVIDRKLARIRWLPMQLDARAEVMDAQRLPMKRWLKGAGAATPDAGDFGNDFIHALARAGLTQGWENGVTQKLAARIGNLFRDLSCLIGLLYYCSWLDDHGIKRFNLTADGDMPRMAAAVGGVVQAAERTLQLQTAERARQQTRRALAKPAPAKKLPPVLQLIANPAFRSPAASHAPAPLPA